MIPPYLFDIVLNSRAHWSVIIQSTATIVYFKCGSIYESSLHQIFKQFLILNQSLIEL
jgi:hypothetical protein